MTDLDPAPDGYTFDPLDVASEVLAALEVVAPDLAARAAANELRWWAELDDDRVPRVRVMDTDARELAVVYVDWRRVGRVDAGPR